MGMLIEWVHRSKRGQSILEYGILLVVVSTALMMMTLYVRRAVQGKLYAIDDMITPKTNEIIGAWTPPI